MGMSIKSALTRLTGVCGESWLQDSASLPKHFILILIRGRRAVLTLSQSLSSCLVRLPDLVKFGLWGGSWRRDMDRCVRSEKLKRMMTLWRHSYLYQVTVLLWVLLWRQNRPFLAPLAPYPPASAVAVTTRHPQLDPGHDPGPAVAKRAPWWLPW